MSSHHHFKKPKLFKSKSPLKPWELTWRNQDGGWTHDTVKQEVTLRVREDVGSVLSHILSLIWTVSVLWPSGAERICEFTVKEKNKKIPRDQKTSAHQLSPPGTRHSDEVLKLFSRCYLSATALCRLAPPVKQNESVTVFGWSCR